jgi:hypothetical protein
MDDGRVDAEWKVQFAVMLARLEERQAAGDRAVSVASEETSRRLEGLNGEASRIQTVLASCVPREVYDRGIESVDKASDASNRELDRRLKLLENGASNLAGRTWIGGAIILIMAAAIAAVIPLVMK